MRTIRTHINKLICAAALLASTAYASDTQPSPSPTPAVTMDGSISTLSGTCPSITFTASSTTIVTTSSTQFGGKSCGDIRVGDHVVIAGTRQDNGSVLAIYVSDSPTQDASPTPTPTPHTEPTPTPTPRTEPTATPTPTPGDDGHHGEVSLRGFYEGLTPGGALAVFYIDDNTHIQVHVIDGTAHAIGFAEGPLTSGAFSLTLTTGQPISGTATDDAITVSLGGQSFQALHVPTFGKADSIAGRYLGVAHGPNGESQVMFIIDANNHIVMIDRSGTTFFGGYGNVTAPVSPATNYTFTLDLNVGSSTPITGSFTITDGTFVGTFTTSDGTFTVNTFKSSLANRMANISTRGLVAPGEGQLIGGFIITGGPKMVLVRAIGPSLASAGVTQPLPNPSLQLYSGSTLLASNDDWKTNTNAAQIVASGLAPTNDLESALLIRLEPGAYTTVVSGGPDTGVALVEVYEAGYE